MRVLLNLIFYYVVFFQMDLTLSVCMYVYVCTPICVFMYVYADKF